MHQGAALAPTPIQKSKIATRRGSGATQGNLLLEHLDLRQKITRFLLDTA
jgi:hypothetical protein